MSVNWRHFNVKMSTMATLLVCIIVLTFTNLNVNMFCVHALTLQPTISSLIFEVNNEEICMYASGKDFYEGMMMHYKLLNGETDFDVFVRDADNKTLYASYAGEHNGEERIYFTTHFKGEHAFCIDNRRYSQGKKRVSVEIGVSSLQRWKTPIDPLRKLMTTTDGYFMGMHEDQMMLRLREPSLRRQIEDMFTLMTIRGVIETVVIALFCVINLFCITRLLKHAHYGLPSTITLNTNNRTINNTATESKTSAEAITAAANCDLNDTIETEVLTGTSLARARNTKSRRL